MTDIFGLSALHIILMVFYYVWWGGSGRVPPLPTSLAPFISPLFFVGLGRGNSAGEPPPLLAPPLAPLAVKSCVQCTPLSSPYMTFHFGRP